MTTIAPLRNETPGSTRNRPSLLACRLGGLARGRQRRREKLERDAVKLAALAARIAAEAPAS